MLVDLWTALAESAGRRFKNGPQGGAKRQENAKKILNRGNEPKDLLKTQHLAFFRAKNEPKTNSILSAKSAYQSGKSRFRVPGPRCQVREEPVSGFRCQGPEVRLSGNTMRPACRRITARPNPLPWDRKALWSAYPSDHIGRPQGTAMRGPSGPAENDS
jgi:hypothetical protein